MVLPYQTMLPSWNNYAEWNTTISPRAAEDLPGFHTVKMIDGSEFTVPIQYTNLHLINEDYGPFVTADDVSEGKKVAIKKISKILGKSMPLQVLRECHQISSLSHPNIVQTLSVFTPQDDDTEFRDVYYVTENMKHNLSEVICKVQLDHRTLSFFLYQILCGVNHLHRQGIVHKDLKPNNIAVNELCQVKVMDCGTTSLSDSSNKSSSFVDVWSIGCIFAEMITGKILFPGPNVPGQWNKILNILGTPTKNFMAQMNPEVTRFYVPPKGLEEIIPDNVFPSNGLNANWTACDARRLLAKMLAIDPNERYSTAEALQDPYVKCWYREEEVNAPLSYIECDRDLDELRLSLNRLNGAPSTNAVCCGTNKKSTNPVEKVKEILRIFKSRPVDNL